MKILGLSAFYHDSAAALLVDGKLIAAAQEERFSRKKHDAEFPTQALKYCLEEGGLALDDLDYIAFYDKPFLKFERLLETYVAFAPRGFNSFRMAMPVWLGEKLFQRHLIGSQVKDQFASGFDTKEKLLFSEHHLSHAASAFYPSPFEEAVVLTMDGVGEWATTSVARGSGNMLEVIKEIHFPHSIGLLYSAFTYYLGFKVNSGEYKVMGLAPYGEPKYVQSILNNIIDVKPDGSFRLNQDYFNYCTGLTMTNDRFAALFGEAVREPDEQLTQFHMDIAASVQAVTEEIVLRLARSLRAETGIPNLCLAGGVALNCVANGKIVKEGIYDNVWIQPASGDAGGAVGAALATHYMNFGNSRTVQNQPDGMSGAYLGPEFDQPDIIRRLTEAGAHFEVLEDDDLYDSIVAALAEGKAVGWMQGRMEFGPRALGARSILGDPRSETMQKTLNLRVKHRESFRPFAPSILREHVSDWFDIDADSPYMLIVADVADGKRRTMTDEEAALFGIEKLNVPRSEIPAVTHVDYSARVQTVDKRTNPRYHALISRFKEATGCPVLVNTSFNVRGEPIVCTPEDAFRCFMGTDIEVLVVGNCLLHKNDQNSALKLDYKNAFELD
ncbi:carbamoyltransferase [Marivibrio halodurans]|uniref:Carbamoyltransferase n=1 Tax=Marivibrio halodurans TaxID=2039722 RepID=A0A8J7S3Z7_9PROT|nr:carbamoyltransferase [Marivibrio halodurans]MBP5858133.1 carbamoyltransferase [Marivibrio halodurans]